MDNPRTVDAGVTEVPALENKFAPCLTCGNQGRRQGAHLFPHTVHKIRHLLWTTGAQVSWAVLNRVSPTTTTRTAAQVPYCTSVRRSRGAWSIA
ncbi:hypothetical protein GCM10022384_47910 [Streptomyces marokkonensis]|uniref:Uncharacterized protein n=1 Tax=Streptomyces marokkonensis TaxID=324855 RepID=A0ABP7RBD0_9ACTN